MQDYENIEYQDILNSLVSGYEEFIDANLKTYLSMLDEFDKGLADDLKDAILLEDRNQLLKAMTKAGIKSFVDETGKKWIRFGEQWFFFLEPEKKKRKINA